MFGHKLIPAITIPALLLGQNPPSKADLERAKRLGGRASLSLIDGTKKDGSITWVNSQFMSVVSGVHSQRCENIDLAQIAAIQIREHPRNSLAEAGSVALLGAALSPTLAGHSLANVFRRLSPPVNPLKGTWESRRAPTGIRRSSLVFEGSSVRRSDNIVRHGRYSADMSQLHLTYDGSSETVIPIRYNCRHLIFNESARTLELIISPRLVEAPIIGRWSDSSSALEFDKDGTFNESRFEQQTGRFENNATAIKIYWDNADQSGLKVWSGHVKRAVLQFPIGNATAEYKYVPPGANLDL